MKKKRLLALGLTCALVGSVGVGLSACGKDNNQSPIDAQDFYAMAAISSVNYLQDETSTSGQMVSATAADSRPSTISQSDVNNIASYMGMFQDMLTNGNSNYYTNGAVEEGDEYAGTYNLKMTMTLPTVDGGEEVFVMYYKEVNTRTNEEIDDGEIELEVNTTLEGVIKVGEETFDVTGRREYEKEGKETEVSFEFTTRSSTNPQNYIKVEHEMEDDEIEYQYSIYNNGNLQSETNVEFENERREKSLELEFINNTTESRNRVKYEITQSTLNENLFNVKLKSATNEKDVRENFTIALGDSGYVFTYSNGFVETVAY